MSKSTWIRDAWRSSFGPRSGRSVVGARQRLRPLLEPLENRTLLTLTLSVPNPLNYQSLSTNPSEFLPAVVGSTYSQAVTATGGSGPYTFTTNSALPPGLALSAAGVVSGTPTATGNYTVTVMATDANDPTNTGTQFSLNVAAQELSVTPAGGFSIPPATIGSSYSQTFTVSGGSGTGYELQNSKFFSELTQNGLSVSLSSSTITVSGTPANSLTPRVYPLEFVLQDSYGDTLVQEYDLQVNLSSGSPLTLAPGTAHSLPVATFGTKYQQEFTVGGGTAGYTIASSDLAANELNDQVSGLSLTQQTGSNQATLSGTPTFTGSALPTSPVAVPFSVTATDNSSPPITVTSWYTLSISPAALTIDTSYLPPAAAGVPYYQSTPADSASGNDGFPIPIQLSVSGGSGTGYSFAVNTGGLPPGLGLLSNGQIIGQPLVTDAPGDYTFTVTATDSANNQTSRQFDLLLLPAATATTPPDYTPQQVIQAYGLNKIILGGGVIGTGVGQTVAIYEQNPGSNFSSSTDQANYDNSDLHEFDNLFGLEDFGDGSVPGQPIFLQLNMNGSNTTAQSPNGEETQDIEWVHAIAPYANIVVLADSNMQTAITTALSETQFQATLNTLAPGATLPPVSVMSISDVTDSIPDSTFVAPNHNVTVVVSAGDRIGPAVGASGGGVAPSSNVLSVGETQLSLNASGAYLGEVGLIGTGAGVSSVESAPSVQQFLNSPVQQFSSSNRATPDVAFLGSVSSAAAEYDSLESSSFHWGDAAYGTSLAAPLWAGLLAIVNQGRQIAGEGPLDGPTQTLPLLYQLPSSDFHKITQLDDGTAIQPGYNLHTGLGSPVANLLVADLIAGQLNASNQLVGGKITISGTVFNDLNLNGQLASNDPGLAGWTATLGSIQNGQFVPGTSLAASTTTNASGGFSFVVAPGLYAVQVTAQSGYVATTTTLQSFGIAPGSTVTTVTTNFGFAAGPVSPPLTLISSATSVPATTPVTLTATISPVPINGSTTIPTGTVTFFDGSTPLATVQLLGNSATYSTSGLAVGGNSVSAQFNPSPSLSGFSMSTSAATWVQVQPPAPPSPPSPPPPAAPSILSISTQIVGRGQRRHEEVQVFFNTSLNPVTAGRLSNYYLTRPGPYRRSRPYVVPIRSVQYDPATSSVTLSLRCHLAWRHMLLSIQGLVAAGTSTTSSTTPVP